MRSLSSSAQLSACNEVYLYDAAKLKRAADVPIIRANPTGERPIGEASVPGWSSDLTPPEYLSDDGDRVFFESRDALSPHATNGLQNVYEWDALTAPAAAPPHQAACT